jgi:hypothetical protein
MSEKVGRNDPCPCGSGKKFKKCHGGSAPSPTIDNDKLQVEMEKLLHRSQAEEMQRQEQQGFGNTMPKNWCHNVLAEK